MYFTWNNPGRVPVLLVPDNVFAYLENGADLMLPGKTCFITRSLSLRRQAHCSRRICNRRFPAAAHRKRRAGSDRYTSDETAYGERPNGGWEGANVLQRDAGFRNEGTRRPSPSHLWRSFMVCFPRKPFDGLKPRYREFGSKSMAPQVPLDDFIAACESRRTADAPDMPADEGGSEDIPAGSTAEEAPKAEEPGMGRLQLEEEPAGQSPQDIEELVRQEKNEEMVIRTQL